MENMMGITIIYISVSWIVRKAGGWNYLRMSSGGGVKSSGYATTVLFLQLPSGTEKNHENQ
jgi:hypothetical protein